MLAVIKASVLSMDLACLQFLSLVVTIPTKYQSSKALGKQVALSVVVIRATVWLMQVRASIR